MPITVAGARGVRAASSTRRPDDYDQYVAFTGPYMVKNDPETGELTGRQPGKRIELVRNPNWDKETDYRPAFLDSITIEEGNDDADVASRRTLRARSCCAATPASRRPRSSSRALRRNKDQLGHVPSGGTRWIALNTKRSSRSTTSTSARPSSPASTATRCA